MSKSVWGWALVLVLLVEGVSGAGALAAPDFTLKDLDGVDRPVREYLGQGKWTVVAVWYSDCPICKRDIHHMAFFHDAHRSKDATVLGVSVDGYARRDKVLGFIADQALDFPHLIAEPRQMAGFGGKRFRGTPTYYLFSPQGELMGERVGAATQTDIEQMLAQARSAGAQQAQRAVTPGPRL